jgi:hypothetical protein
MLAQLIDSSASFTDDLIMQDLALKERLNAMIDRAVKRLVQSKAWKTMLPSAQMDRSALPSKKVNRLPQ